MALKAEDETVGDPTDEAREAPFGDGHIEQR
jgi:hypothetical protein